MLKYILKRILIFIPTLLAISLVTFYISINAPGDPVENFLHTQTGEGMLSDRQAAQRDYAEVRHKLGFDLPQFYFSVSNATHSDTIFRIPNTQHIAPLERLSWDYGNWDNVSDYYHALLDYETAIFSIAITDTNNTTIVDAKMQIEQLLENTKSEEFSLLYGQLKKMQQNKLLASANPAFSKLDAAWNKMQTNQSSWRRYIPTFEWYGSHNQYHRWMFGDAKWFTETDTTKSRGFIRGDFGLSYAYKDRVTGHIMQALPRSIFLSIFSIFLAYLIAVPVGVRSAVNKGKLSERFTSTGLFMMYSLPNFWIATILVIFFCGGDWFSWFPSPGAEPIPDDAPFGYWFPESLKRYLLPVICATYASLAFISRQMRGGMLNVLSQDYIRTARAKGLSERTVIWKHALRNSLLPIITVFANAFPAAVSGSFVIEYIFNIPGMGKLTYEAIQAHDYPIVFAVMMMVSLMTLLGILVADILYAVVDPRIAFSSKRS